MDARLQKGLCIARLGRIKPIRLGWRVPSQANKGHYVVNLDGESPFCTCPDFETRRKPCKHIFAVEFMTERRTAPDGTVTETRTVKVTYRQEWSAYNAAQINEKDHFQVLLRDLCNDLSWPETKRRGRPRLPLNDAIFSAVFKVYSTFSARRFMSDLRAAHRAGHIGRVPCHNSVLNVFDAPVTKPILDDLIVKAALPLKSVESSFACDSSGFGACRFDRWFDHAHRMQRMRRSWVKAHVMCGVKTNVVTALEIHDKNAADAPLLPPLLAATAANFNVSEVSADLGYSSEANLRAIIDTGAGALIPFKRNATPDKGGLWAKMFHLYNLRRDEFLSRYHLRSNVESTFHMIKSKFGDSVRAKTDRAMRNEVRAKVLCHNICCLIQSMYEMGVGTIAGTQLPFNRLQPQVQ